MAFAVSILPVCFDLKSVTMCVLSDRKLKNVFVLLARELYKMTLKGLGFGPVFKCLTGDNKVVTKLFRWSTSLGYMLKLEPLRYYGT